MAETFPSKRDGWLVAVIWLAGVLLVVTAWIPIVAGPFGALRVPLAIVHLGTAGFAFWVLYGTAYRVGERELLVRSGPFRWRIPIDAITTVTPTANPLSSPAVSLDRLRIAYRAARGDRALMVSPADKAGFLAALAARGAPTGIAG
jgi:hypothetical protein